MVRENTPTSDEIRQRAQNRCEYCHLPTGAVPAQFHIEHIRAKSHGGATVLSNLALACSRCNLHKGPNLAGIDPSTNEMTRLFDPRTDGWFEHFQRQGAIIRGLTPVGRATVTTLAMNDRERVRLRLMLISIGKLPQEDPPK